jgi:hypothetical protein
MEPIDSQLANPLLELTADVGEIARLLFATGSVEATLARIVELAVETIEGCAFAGIFLLEGEMVVTPAFTDPVVSIIDRLQHANSEGPCLAAIGQGLASYADDLEVDTRWPAFGPEATAAGIGEAALPVRGAAGLLPLLAICDPRVDVGHEAVPGSV